MRKTNKTIAFVLFFLVILISLSGCGKKETEEESLKKKINAEISYIDSQLISMANLLNNISYSKYKVINKEVEEESEATQNTRKRTRE